MNNFKVDWVQLLSLTGTLLSITAGVIGSLTGAQKMNALIDQKVEKALADQNKAGKS